MEKLTIEVQKYGAAKDLVVCRSSDVVQPQGHQMLIDVHYSGVNFADIVMRLGFYRDAPPRPFTPGYEVSGVVRAVGSQVTRFKVGDRVIAGTRFGGYTNQALVDDWQVFHLPKGLDLKEAAALPVNYITAYIALEEFGRIRQGDRILMDCATGGVGVIAMQMAARKGATVVGLTTTPSKKAFIESYGAKAYTFEEFERSGEKNFDFILNSSGGSSLKRQYPLLNRSGKIVCIGVQSGIQDGKRSLFRFLKAALSSPWFPILKLTMQSRMAGGFNALAYFDDQAWMTKHLIGMEDCEFKPHVGEVFAAEEAWKAHEALEQKRAKGKVLLQWAQS